MNFLSLINYPVCGILLVQQEEAIETAVIHWSPNIEILALCHQEYYKDEQDMVGKNKKAGDNL